MEQPGAAPGRARFPAAARRMRPPRHPVVSVVVRRLLLSIPLLFVVSAFVFLLTALVPGDAAYTILGPDARPEQYVELSRELGLDKPLPEQYWNWSSDAIQGDLGSSLVTGIPITDTILERLPVTISLVIGTLLVSIILGVALGILSAVRGGVAGRLVDVVATFGFVVPVFWLAAELIVVFSVKLGWFPVSGYTSFLESPSEWLLSLVLPVTALSAAAVAWFAKFTRDAMLEALSSTYVRMARANGIPESSIVFRHAFRNASIQVVTFAGMVFVGLLTGTVFVESVFVLPGLGSLVVAGVEGGDLPMVQGLAVVFTLIVVAVNLAIDLLYSLLDPRVRTA